MSLLLTGATGYIGSSVLRSLVERGHTVTALVRSEEKAAQVGAAGANAVVGSITDLDLLRRLVAESDGVIHTASPGDETSAAVDGDLVDVVVGEFSGTDRPFVHTGGIWIFGAGDDLDESTPPKPLPITGWRLDVERKVRESDVHTTIIAPGIVYGRGAGIPSMLIGQGEVRLVGDGSQHWTSVHVDDLGVLYALAYEKAAADEYYLGASGENPTVRELGEAVSQGADVVAESAQESRDRLGEAFADALLLDQQASGSHAKESLGWTPSGPSLVDDLASGSYTR
ncbi:dTDP-4-oxo-6-deoxy-D-allose reductase [Frondihabitans sp. 762G35]|uniref:NAD(P)H-binding protein n=1 Tax=Frondihabitans sp. 762G35 TaxID=1446794 RepID=UPI000D2222AF|nr:NAD(P)H-binding protein [Frondihabitans sp. 762G35]ARC56434.1 dTDP-4-oxo-6-deoxy-D-allose reductase [Frondihabitans sp. 762G35]